MRLSPLVAEVRTNLRTMADGESLHIEHCTHNELRSIYGDLRRMNQRGTFRKKVSMNQKATSRGYTITITWAT